MATFTLICLLISGDHTRVKVSFTLDASLKPQAHQICQDMAKNWIKK